MSALRSASLTRYSDVETKRGSATVRAIRWAYGVTTVPSRRADLLPRTLASLKSAGFDAPRLFIDGCAHDEASSYEKEFRLEATSRQPLLRTALHWILTLAELWFRDPKADRYAIFQDDLLACRNLRQYLERCRYPEKGYWNLYTFPSNQELATGQGWYQSNQLGKGAIGLVFDRETVLELLSSREHILERPLAASKPWWRKIDGGIVDALAKRGRSEYVHNPSLLCHTGLSSTTRPGRPIPPEWATRSFPGEEFDAMKLVAQLQPKAPSPSGIAYWEREVSAIARAIDEDRERARRASGAERERFEHLAESYTHKLADAERNLAALKGAS